MGTMILNIQTIIVWKGSEDREERKLRNTNFGKLKFEFEIPKQLTSIYVSTA